MIKQWIWNFLFKNDVNFVLNNIQTDEELEQALKHITELDLAIQELNGSLDNNTDIILQKQQLIAELQEQFEAIETEKELELLWNNKRPKTRWFYPGRPDPITGERMFIDPRIFYTYDETLTRNTRPYNDDRASACLDYVARNITYTSDPKEYWQFAYETHKRRKGDCEDGSILMVNMMLMSGIPYWRIRLNAGSVQGGGHAWVTYLREEDNEWYVMDWCYFYNESKGFKKKWSDAEKYFKIWGSWNTKFIFGDLPKEAD